MPSAYTHFFIAEKIVSLLPQELQKAALAYPRLYFLGAQGADFCFFYRALHASEINFGRYLHNRGSFEFFRTLALCAAHSPEIFAYALGYITHYAADCTFHPYVYFVSGKSPVKHSRTEGAIDCYFKKQALAIYYDGTNKSLSEEKHNGDISSSAALEKPKASRAELFRKNSAYFNCAPTIEEKNSLYAVYALAAAKAGRFPLIKPAFFRSIHSYLAYVKVSAKVFAGNTPEAVNLTRREWHYPDDKKIIKTDGAEELFSRAVDDGISLCKEFAFCVREKQPLSKNLFGKNFLSGL